MLTDNMNTSKGMSHVMWIITAIIVCLATALIVIAMLNKSIIGSEEGTKETMETSSSAIKMETCQRACDSCKRLGENGVCSSDRWSTIGSNCLDIMPDCS